MATRTVVIRGAFPGLNEYINAERTNRYKAAAMKRQCQGVVVRCAKSQLRGFRPKGAVVMAFAWYERDRRRDKDNVAAFGRKVIQDGLVAAGVLKNDGWKEIAGFTDAFFVDKLAPRIEVTITEVAE
jgi:Holliday junction resolvase RusA-like endonuclease